MLGLSASSVGGLLVGVFLVGGAAQGLAPAIQTRLMDVAEDSQTLAAAVNHSALNIGNSPGAFLGGAAIAAGLGFLAPTWLGLSLVVPGVPFALLGWSPSRAAGPVSRGLSLVVHRDHVSIGIDERERQPKRAFRGRRRNRDAVGHERLVQRGRVVCQHRQRRTKPCGRLKVNSLVAARAGRGNRRGGADHGVRGREGGPREAQLCLVERGGAVEVAHLQSNEVESRDGHGFLSGPHRMSGP